MLVNLIRMKPTLTLITINVRLHVQTQSTIVSNAKNNLHCDVQYSTRQLVLYLWLKSVVV